MIRKDPIFFAEGSLGKLLKERAREEMMGRNTPPARAVVLGMAGEMSTSLAGRGGRKWKAMSRYEMR